MSGYKTYTLGYVGAGLEDHKHVILNADNGNIILRDPEEYKAFKLTKEEAREFYLILKEIYDIGR